MGADRVQGDALNFGGTAACHSGFRRPKEEGGGRTPAIFPSSRKLTQRLGSSGYAGRSAPTAERAGTGYRQSGRRSTTMPSLKPATASTFGTGRTASAD